MSKNRFFVEVKWWHILSVAIGFIGIGLGICCFIEHTIITSNESIILIFAGLIATFIVVGNYAQVQNIKKEFEDRINKLDEQVKDIAQNFGNVNKKEIEELMALIKINNEQDDTATTIAPEG